MFNSTLGAKFSPDGIDFSVCENFSFFKNQKHDVGTSLLWHVSYFPEVSKTQDLLFGLFYKLQPVKWFSFFVQVNAFSKERTIFALPKDFSPLVNNSFAFALRTTFIPIQKINFYFEISSYEFFRYMLFCAPTFATGFSISLNEKTKLIFDCKAHYIDFFTLSAGFESAEFSLGVGVGL